MRYGRRGRGGSAAASAPGAVVECASANCCGLRTVCCSEGIVEGVGLSSVFCKKEGLINNYYNPLGIARNVTVIGSI